MFCATENKNTKWFCGAWLTLIWEVWMSKPTGSAQPQPQGYVYLGICVWVCVRVCVWVSVWECICMCVCVGVCVSSYPRLQEPTLISSGTESRQRSAQTGNTWHRWHTHTMDCTPPPPTLTHRHAQKLLRGHDTQETNGGCLSFLHYIQQRLCSLRDQTLVPSSVQIVQ